MLTKEDKKLFRADLFKHLDGIVIAPVAFSLYQKGITQYLLQQQKISCTRLASICGANEGYLNVALRMLASQGWVEYTFNDNEVLISCNANTEIAFSLFYLYESVVDLLNYSGNFHPRKFEAKPFQKLERLYHQYYRNFDLKISKNTKTASIQQQILKHIEGVLVGPTIVFLGMGGMFHKYFMEASFTPEEYHKNPESFDIILSFLSLLGWFKQEEATYTFTPKGLFFAKRATAYGVTVSYIPMFRKINDLLYGDANILWNSKITHEIHVDREMNVWGSGGAHIAYFKKIDESIITIFNQPLELQPKGILDMGCGNGAFLIHLFETIASKTLRGKHLDNHPLFLVGADYNKAALKVTRANLVQADIWAKVIWGDIGNPDQLHRDLLHNYNIALKDLLSVRTFLDHNRIWSTPIADIKTASLSTGAFAYRGQKLSGDEVERNLKDHFLKWTPYIAKYGLILIELHTISPKITSKNLGKTAATAYDATHGFSDQYILEIDSFLKIIEESGLKSVPSYFHKFPNSELATVSIHYLLGA